MQEPDEQNPQRIPTNFSIILTPEKVTTRPPHPEKLPYPTLLSASKLTSLSET